MAVLRHLCFLLLFIVFSGVHLSAEPPYMWYATYSINNYSANGSCGRGNLQRSHEGAAAFSTALEAMNLQNTWYKFNRKDSDCLAYRWTGEYAEVNQVDFVYYRGHGCGKGPDFGCNPEYQISNTDDIRLGGSGYLKWVLAESCSWFTAAPFDDCQSGMSAKERWKPCFKGVHAILGHAGKTWESEHLQEAAQVFWNDWCMNGYSIKHAWFNSRRYLYNQGGIIGTIPVVAAASDAYANETFANASDAPAPAPINGPYIELIVIGHPVF